METKSTISAHHPILDQIRMLSTLHDHGMIPTREFESKQADLRSADVSEGITNGGTLVVRRRFSRPTQAADHAR